MSTIRLKGQLRQRKQPRESAKSQCGWKIYHHSAIVSVHRLLLTVKALSTISDLQIPRWGLYKRHFRVSQNSVQKPFYEKLSSLDPHLPVRFEWTEYTGEHRPPLEYRP